MRPGARSAALANSLVSLGKNPSEGVCRDVLLWLQAEPDAIGLVLVQISIVSCISPNPPKRDVRVVDTMDDG